MDGGRAPWLLLLFWEMPSKLMECCWAHGLTGSVFHRKKKGTLVATMCLHTIQLVIYVVEGRNGWMAADSAGYHLHLIEIQTPLTMNSIK